MANKRYVIMLKNKDEINGPMNSRQANTLAKDYINGCKNRRTYKDKEGYIALDMNNVTAILINDDNENTNKKIGF